METDENEDKKRWLRNRRTKGFIKLNNYFEDVLRRNVFQDRIKVLKKQYRKQEIPQEEIKKLCDEYELKDPVWWDIVLEYINTGHYDREENIYAYSYDLLDIEEVLDEEYPVILKISPYANIKDIVSYINKNSKLIKRYQETHKKPEINIGKARTKSVSNLARSDLVYENRHLPLKEIRKILLKNGYNLDDGHIGKLLSIENKKRKQV